jgi:hypothetical protein
MSTTLGILLASACALASNVAFLFKHRGACRCAPVRYRRPLTSAAALWRSPWFALGMLVGGGAWLLHVGAMALAPLSVVQAVLAGGVAVLAVLAERLFGLPVTARQRWGLALTATGLILLAVTLPDPTADHARFSLPVMAAFEAALFGAGALLVAGPRLGGRAPHHGVMLAAAAGILFGVCNVAIKAVTEIVKHDGALSAVLAPWPAIALAASVVAFYASARSLQDGEAIAVIAITGTAANIAGIAGGIIVFQDPLPGNPLGVAVQAAAFLLVIIASALTPAPLRAAVARGT